MVTIQLSADEITELLICCEYCSAENEDFITARSKLREAYKVALEEEKRVYARNKGRYSHDAFPS